MHDSPHIFYFVTNSCCCLFAGAVSDEGDLTDIAPEDDWRCWSSAAEEADDSESDSDSDTCPDLGEYFCLSSKFYFLTDNLFLFHCRSTARFWG